MNYFRNKKIILGGLIIGLIIIGAGPINAVNAQSAGGAVFGAGTGAAAGAALGSIVPGVGTTAGAAVGGAVGGLVGLIGGGSIIGGIAAKGIGWVVAIIGYIAGFIAAIVFYIGGQLVQLSLNLNAKLLTEGSIVYLGWPIILNITNLGFVFAIIVMAFATIFQLESYAMKKTLWKLIVAALLVNFSLVIAGAFINVAANFTDFFIQRAMPQEVTDFSKTLADLFKAQQYLKASEVEKSQEALKGLGEFSGALLGFIAQIFFTAAFTFLGALTLLALAIMLLIRYVALGILLILSPIVWLFWIFPYTEGYWKKWWTEFMRWVFFAPATSFFLYLTVATIRSAQGQKYFQEIIKVSESPSALGSQVGVVLGLDIIGNLVIVTGLLLGGLYVANQMGITFANTAYGWAQSTGKMFGGWVGRKAIEKTGGRILGSERVKKLTEKMSASRIPGIRFVGQGLNRLGMSTEKFIQDQYEELAKKLTPDRLNYEILNSRGTKRATLLKEAAKRKDIDFTKLTSVIGSPEEMVKIKSDFDRSGLNFKDLEKAIGRSLKMIQSKTDEQLREATDEFVKSLLPKDYASGQWNDIFKKTDDMQLQHIQKQLAGAFAEHTPGAYAKVVPHINGENLDDFRTIIDTEIQLLKRHPDATMRARGEKAENAFNKTMDRRSLFGEEAWIPPREGVT